jgi:hypothetical protein
MTTWPDRDLMIALVKLRVDVITEGPADLAREFARRAVPIGAELSRRIAERKSQAASTGTADCGGW